MFISICALNYFADDFSSGIFGFSTAAGVSLRRIGGKTSGDAQRELSIVGKDNAERAISETTQWFDPQGKN